MSEKSDDDHSYSGRLANHGSFLTRWAHRSRWRATSALLEGLHFDNALDYGCADAWFFHSAYESGLIKRGTGIDIDLDILQRARVRFAARPQFRFSALETIDRLALRGTFDLLVCTETLEHVREPLNVLELLDYLGCDGATILISVPIEIGPPLLLKQAGRYLANLGKRTYGYEAYRWRELISAGVFFDTESFPHSHRDTDAVSKGHKGFDYRELDREIRARFDVGRVVCTPIPWLGRLGSSTIFWKCTRRS